MKKRIKASIIVVTVFLTGLTIHYYLVNSGNKQEPVIIQSEELKDTTKADIKQTSDSIRTISNEITSRIK